jgi:hypothetical protein
VKQKRVRGKIINISSVDYVLLRLPVNAEQGRELENGMNSQVEAEWHTTIHYKQGHSRMRE